MADTRYKHSEVEDLKSEIQESGVSVLCADILIKEYVDKGWKETRVILRLGYSQEDFDLFISNIEEAFNHWTHFDIKKSFVWLLDGSWLEQYSELEPYSDGESKVYWHRRVRPVVPTDLN